MAKVLRPIGHEDRLSIVDHLDELRSRLIICGIALVIAFAACFWQNHALLKVLNRALPATPATSSNHISGLTGDSVRRIVGGSRSSAGGTEFGLPGPAEGSSMTGMRAAPIGRSGAQAGDATDGIA